MNCLDELIKKIEFAQKPVVIAIDGKAASGKTTLSKLLEAELGSSTVHTDDFFLPLEMRTDERLSEAGGNIHYERFIKEVLPNLKSDEDFEYGVFDCSKMKITSAKAVKANDITVVEGAYSCHPCFGDYADIKVFMTVDKEEQMKRITERNGEEHAEQFKKFWIPMEEKYFEAFDIQNKADIILD